MNQPIIMHVNYVEQGQTVDEMVERAVRFGFDGIEFRRKRANVDETPEQYVDAIASAQKKHGMKVVCFGGPGANLMQPDAGERRKALDEYIAFWRLAVKRFDMSVNNCFSGSLLNPDKSVPYRECTRHGSYIATDDHYAWAAEGYRELGDVAAELGFQLAFETHMAYLHDSPAPTWKLLQMIDKPAVGVNLDYVNITALPDQPSLEETINLFGDKLFYVHLKNTYVTDSGDRLRVGLGEGQVNNREFLRLLKKTGYAGPLCIEAPRPGDREWYAQQDLAYLKSVLNDLGY